MVGGARLHAKCAFAQAQTKCISQLSKGDVYNMRKHKYQQTSYHTRLLGGRC